MEKWVRASGVLFIVSATVWVVSFSIIQLSSSSAELLGHRRPVGDLHRHGCVGELRVDDRVLGDPVLAVSRSLGPDEALEGAERSSVRRTRPPSGAPADLM